MFDKLNVDKFRVSMYLDSLSFDIIKDGEGPHHQPIYSMDIDDLYVLEFIVSELKRKFNCN